MPINIAKILQHPFTVIEKEKKMEAKKAQNMTYGTGGRGKKHGEHYPIFDV